MNSTPFRSPGELKTAAYEGFIQALCWTISDDNNPLIFRSPDELWYDHDFHPWDQPFFLSTFADNDDGSIFVLKLLPDTSWAIYCTEYDDCPDLDTLQAEGFSFAYPLANPTS